MAKQESHVAAFYDKATLGSTREERQQDPTYQLKRYHNLVKRQLIQVCSRNVSYHLDIACGRGGDIDKWLDAGIRHVLGLDISPNEIESAHKRLKIIQERRRERADIRFRVETEVGLRALNLSRHDFHREYDSVSCMFSAHFFFASEPFFHHLLANVSSALRDRGFFYGTAASGPSVEALLADQPVFTSEFLHVRRHFAAAPAARAPATSNEVCSPSTLPFSKSKAKTHQFITSHRRQRSIPQRSVHDLLQPVLRILPLSLHRPLIKPTFLLQLMLLLLLVILLQLLRRLLLPLSLPPLPLPPLLQRQNTSPITARWKFRQRLLIRARLRPTRRLLLAPNLPRDPLDMATPLHSRAR
eukprot:m.162023 g.162023  ORF g.162023 m.162023 type:complete len:357 (+) comp15201_c3_seq12:4294-5364(+)